MNPPKYELHCQRCDVEHPVWSVTNDEWNAVIQEGEHFLCPTCFIVLARERGITKGIWRMRLEILEERK